MSTTEQFSGSPMVSAPDDAVHGPHAVPAGSHASALVAEDVSAWFSGRLVLEQVNLDMARSKVTALIGPSGCGLSLIHI